MAYRDEDGILRPDKDEIAWLEARRDRLVKQGAEPAAAGFWAYVMEWVPRAVKAERREADDA